MKLNDTQAVTDNPTRAMARRRPGRAVTPTSTGADLIGAMDEVEHLAALRDSVDGHDTRYDGLWDGRHVMLRDISVRCARAVWCALMADSWLQLSKFTADFRARYHRGYRAREVRYALDRMVSVGVLERRPTPRGYEWRATPRTIASWNQINWTAIGRAGEA